MDPVRPARSPISAALLWATLHAPLLLLFFRHGLGPALADAHGSTRVLVAAGFGAEALFLSALPFLVTLPLAGAARLYRFAVPLACGLMAAFVWGDALLHRSMGFHLNGLVLRVALQPNALRETGLPTGEVVRAAVVLLLLLSASVALGARFIRGGRGLPRWGAWLLAILALEGADRAVGAVRTFREGPAGQAAAHVLPLQPPLRMNRLLARLTGSSPAGLMLSDAAHAPLPPGDVSTSEIQFTRTPDVVLVLTESLRADFFSPEVMPRLWNRAQRGAVYERHYAAASATHFTLFSLLFGLHAQRSDAVLGAGRTPLLFSTLRAHGYQLKVITASSVDWMGLRKTVFHDLSDADLETDPPGADADARDASMVAHAEKFAADADPRKPIFLLVFFDGTHFNYHYPARSERFTPCWDGRGALEAKELDPELIRRRAQNAAFEVDQKLDELLSFITARRGRAPTVLFTGDHGESFGEGGRVGHASGVYDEQIHVPLVLLDETVKPGRRTSVTSHVDVVPTLLSLLGDTHPAARYSDGMPLDSVPANRFALSTVGWDLRSALVGRDLKVWFLGEDAGLGAITLTDPFDHPLVDARERFQREAPHILSALGSPAAR